MNEQIGSIAVIGIMALIIATIKFYHYWQDKQFFNSAKTLSRHEFIRVQRNDILTATELGLYWDKVHETHNPN